MPMRAKSNRNSAASGKLALTLQLASVAASMPPRTLLRRWVKAALQRPAELTLRIVDEGEARSLNKQFRGKDYATNVLTFVYHAGVHAEDEAGLAGDIVLCAPVVEREAREQGKPLLAHYAHLTVHGVLHLQGYDHERVREAKVMEQLEVAVLAKLGYANPYQKQAKAAARKAGGLALHS